MPWEYKAQVNENDYGYLLSARDHNISLNLKQVVFFDWQCPWGV